MVSLSRLQRSTAITTDGATTVENTMKTQVFQLGYAVNDDLSVSYTSETGEKKHPNINNYSL